jgi:hypothetical protein
MNFGVLLIAIVGAVFAAYVFVGIKRGWIK